MAKKDPTIATHDSHGNLTGSMATAGKKVPTSAKGVQGNQGKPTSSKRETQLEAKRVEVLNTHFDELVRKERMYLKRALENVGHYAQLVEKKQAIVEHRTESAKDVVKIEARRMVALASPENAIKRLKLKNIFEWEAPRGIWHHSDFVTRAQMVTPAEAQKIFTDWKKVSDTRAWHGGREKFCENDEMDNDLMVRYGDIWPDFTFEDKDAMWNSIWESAANAEAALLIRNKLSQKEYDALSRPWRKVVGRIHPKDEDIFEG